MEVHINLYQTVKSFASHAFVEQTICVHFKKVLFIGERLRKRRPQRSLILEQPPLILHIHAVAAKVPVLDFDNNNANSLFYDYDIRALTIEARLKVNLSFWVKSFF
ncbi:hypothetical protein D9M69_576030 [compost metagenome]